MSTGWDRTWVEIEWTILEPRERAENIPEDTAALPYVGRARGLVAGAPRVGDQAEIVTQAGRVLRGVVVDEAPGYTHSFGHVLPAWVQMRDSIRAGLWELDGGD